MAKSVLIVEDDRDLGAILAEVLEEQGYEVSMAGNGLEALERLRAGPPPDVILLDIMMPVMDGWEFRNRQRAKQEVASIPVIAMSADGDVNRKGTSLGAAGSLRKPVTIEALLAEVERVCGGRSAA